MAANFVDGAIIDTLKEFSRLRQAVSPRTGPSRLSPPFPPYLRTPASEIPWPENSDRRGNDEATEHGGDGVALAWACAAGGQRRPRRHQRAEPPKHAIVPLPPPAPLPRRSP